MVGGEKAKSVSFQRRFKWVDKKSFDKYKGKSVEYILTELDPGTIYASRNQIEVHSTDLKTVVEEDPEKFPTVSSRYLTEQVLWFILEGKMQELRKQKDRLYEPVLLEYLSHDLGNLLYVEKTIDRETFVVGRKLKDMGRFNRDHRAEYLEVCQGKDLLVIPLAEGNHYTLCIVKVREKTIEFFDSQISKKLLTDVSKIYPPEFNEIFCIAGEDQIQEPLKWKLVQEVLQKLFPNTLGDLTKVIHKNLPKQEDNFSCGFFVMMYACFTMRGEVMDPLVHDNDYVVTTFRRSLVKYMMGTTDTRDPLRVQPGKPSSDVMIVEEVPATEDVMIVEEVTTTDDVMIVQEVTATDDVMVVEDATANNDTIVVEDVTASDVVVPDITSDAEVIILSSSHPASNMDVEPEPVKHVSFRCDSPKYQITDSEDEPDDVKPMNEDKPGPAGNEPKLEHNFNVNYSLNDAAVSNAILNFEDSRALEKIIEIPFIGKDIRNHNKTYNNPTGEWQVMRVFTEIKELINGDGSLKFTQKVRDVILKELPRNPDLFVEWLKGRSGGSDSRVNRYDFCWSDSVAYKFVKSKLVKVGTAPPKNPLQKAENQKKYRKRKQKKQAAKNLQ